MKLVIKISNTISKVLRRSQQAIKDVNSRSETNSNHSLHTSRSNRYVITWRIMKSVKYATYYILAVNVFSLGCPHETENVKAAYKSGEILDQTTPITLANIKRKLKESGIFNWQDPTLTEREKKELTKLFDAVEIMTTSRVRQPSNVQNIFYSLRLVERAVKKQLKEGQLSESLAGKFKWEKLSSRPKRDKPTYHIDKTTNMRIFDKTN